MLKRNGIQTRLRIMKVGYINGEVFDYPRKTLVQNLYLAKKNVEAGFDKQGHKWSQWRFHWEWTEGDVEPLIYIYKERKRERVK